LKKYLPFCVRLLDIGASLFNWENEKRTFKRKNSCWFNFWEYCIWIRYDSSKTREKQINNLHWKRV